jgi:PAS domain S-box-containing protein
MEFAPMASEEQRARRAGGGFLRLADDRRRAGVSTTADEQLGTTAVALLEGSPEGIAMIDASGTVVFWNAAAEQLFGLERSRAIGQELASLIFPDHLQTAVRAVLLREVDEPGDELAQRQIELGARRADGREIPVDIATTPIELDAAKLLAIHLRDASERSERERELHSDARRRSAVLDLGQVALEGMALDELLQRAVALTIDELGVDRCVVW